MPYKDKLLCLNPIQKQLEHRYFVSAMVVTESIFVNVVLKIFRGYGMIDTRDTTLHKRPEPFNVVGMDRTSDILTYAMLYPKMVVSEFSKMVITLELISVKDRLAGYILFDERGKGTTLNIGNYSSSNTSLTLNRPHDFSFAFSTTSTLTRPLTADVCFVNFHFACKIPEVFAKKDANLFEHSPCRFVGHSSFPFYLFSRDTTTSGSHAIDNLKPYLEGCCGLVEYSSSSRVNLMPTVIALIARAFGYFMVFCYLVAYWAMYTIRIAMAQYPFKANIIIWEFGFKICESVFVHFFIPLYHILYHSPYMLSRDNYLSLIPHAKCKEILAFRQR